MLLGIRRSRASIHWYRVGRSSTVCAGGGRGASNLTREWTPVHTGRLGRPSVVPPGAGVAAARLGGASGCASAAAGAGPSARSRVLERGGVSAVATAEAAATERGAGGAAEASR